MRRLGAIVAVALGICGCARDRAETSSKTLLAWKAGRQEPTDEPTGEAKDAGGGNSKEPGPITTDRPDFTEASSTVGKGRIQLESGYTYIRDHFEGTTTSHNSYPEALLRIGLIADWFEFRIGQNFGHVGTRSPSSVFSAGGGEDLYLGVKLGLTEQKGIFPEMALVIQGQIPSGHHDFTAGRVLPGLNLLYGWDVVPDLISLGGSTQGNSAVDGEAHTYLELAQSLTVGYSLTDRLGAYTECYAFFPSGATAAGVGPQYYFDGGFTYQLTPNFQLDIRAGVGLNRQADDIFAGTGFAVRY